MAPMSGKLLSLPPLAVAAAACGVAVAMLLVAYGFGTSQAQATAGGVVSALALVGIAGAGLLYAWRLGAGGSFE